MLMMGLVPFKEVHRLRALIECVDITTGLHLLIEVLLLVSWLATDRPTQDLTVVRQQLMRTSSISSTVLFVNVTSWF